MHIITGMLLAGILGRKNGGSILPMLRTGPVRTAHAMPGRVRFEVPSLVDAPAQAEQLQSRMAALEGVERVVSSPTTGSETIEYREKLVRPELLFAAVVRLLGLEKEMEKPPQPVVVRELRSLLDSLNRVVYDRTGGLLDFTSALLIVLAGLGLSKVVQHGASAMPSGFTLIWWGVRQLLGGGNGGE
jgi:hypothetical protein